ncbi:MAG: hypothetical protein ACON4R_10195 [Akkermansiaceae bacterium]
MKNVMRWFFTGLVGVAWFCSSCQEDKQEPEKAKLEPVQQSFDEELVTRFRSVVANQNEVTRLIGEFMRKGNPFGGEKKQLEPQQQEAIAEMRALQLKVVDDLTAIMASMEAHPPESRIVDPELLADMKGSIVLATLSGGAKSIEKIQMFQASVTSVKQVSKLQSWLTRLEKQLGDKSAEAEVDSPEVNSSPRIVPDGWKEKGYCIGFARISADHLQKSNAPSVQIGEVAYLFRGKFQKFSEADLGKKIKVTGTMVKGRLPMFIQSKDWKGVVPQGIPVPPGTDIEKESLYYFVQDPKWEIVEE